MVALGGLGGSYERGTPEIGQDIGRTSMCPHGIAYREALVVNFRAIHTTRLQTWL